MASSYTTNFSIEKMATGDQSGTWGTTTNHNFDIIDRIVSYKSVAITTNADTHTLTVREASPGSGTENLQDGMYRVIKFTGALDSNCTVTIAPNTAGAFFIIINSTTDSGSSGPYSLILSQGSGANVTVANGKSAVVYCDGAGSGAAVVNALSAPIFGSTLTIGDGTAEDTKLVYDGNAKDFYMGLDDSADKLVVGVGSAVGTNSILTLDDDSVTIGDGAAADTKLVYDGNAKDFYVGLDDSADVLIIGEGSTVGTNPILTLTDDSVTVGDGAAADTKIVYDGNAKDFYVGLDDSADKLVIGVGSTVGTNSILTLDDDSVTVGDGAAVDTKIVFDGNAQDYYIGLDDSADDLVIGLGSAVGTTPAISIDENQVTTFGKATVGATLTDTSNTGSVTLDFQTSQNFVLTLTGNVTLANPSTEAVGQSGIMVFIQDGTGSRTLSLGTDYETAGGAGITLSTAASAVDVVPYFVKAAGSIQLGAPQKAFA
tara:strand:+ start:4046 stop:5503 length:1458 start_codon:yes stop_codon:yes gene_type:complete